MTMVTLIQLGYSKIHLYLYHPLETKFLKET